MVKKILFMLTAFVFVFSSVGISLALEKGNKRKGKYSYRKVYKACYQRGEVASKTPPVSPADKTMDEWTSIFETKDFKQFGCEEEWGQLSDEARTDIYTYMHDHGSDSPTPAKCK
jgi:hypothetical protein